jgi:hypothetical protein
MYIEAPSMSQFKALWSTDLAVVYPPQPLSNLTFIVSSQMLKKKRIPERQN